MELLLCEKGSSRIVRACRFDGMNRNIIRNEFENAGIAPIFWIHEIYSMLGNDYIVYGTNPLSDPRVLSEELFNRKYEVI